MKKICTISMLLAGLLLIQTSYSAPGLFFNVSPNGTHLSITTNVPTHPWPYSLAGLIVETAGFSAASGPGVNCTPDGKVCSFDQIGNNLPVSLRVAGPSGGVADLVLCLNLPGGKSCQHSFIQIGGLNLTYVLNGAGYVSKCSLDGSGNLTTCSITANGLTGIPSSITFNSLRNVAYIASQGGAGRIDKCSIAASGDLVGCVPTGGGGAQSAIALNSAQTFAYTTRLNGNVTTCAIDILGNLVNCSDTLSGSTFLSDITINPAGNFAYIVATGIFSSDIVRCSIGADGAISGCVVTEFAPVNPADTPVLTRIAINSVGTFVYLSAPFEDDVWQCAIDGTGAFVNCASTGGFNNPGGLVVNSAGTSLYVTNRDGNNVSRCTLNPVSGAIIPPCVTSGSGMDVPADIAFLNLNI